jgi:hypothetical protein
MNFFFQKSCRLLDNVEKYGRAGQATDDNLTWCKHTACWINKATVTHSEYATLIVSTAKMGKRTCLNVTLHVRFPTGRLIKVCLPPQYTQH